MEYYKVLLPSHSGPYPLPIETILKRCAGVVHVYCTDHWEGPIYDCKDISMIWGVKIIIVGRITSGEAAEWIIKN